MTASPGHIPATTEDEYASWFITGQVPARVRAHERRA